MAGNETKQEVINKHAKAIGMSFWRYGINYILVLFEIAAIVLLTLMSVGFDGWEFLLTAQFIITTLILFGIYTATHWTLYNLRIKKLRSSQEHLDFETEIETELKTFVNTKEWYEDGDKFLNERKTNKKVEAWKTLMQNSIKRLKDKSTYKSRSIETAQVTEYQRKNLNESDLLALQESFDKKRNKNRYVRKKRLYEQQLTDKWIAENLMSIKVEHDDVDKQFIETGSLIKGVAKSQTKERGKYAKDNWSSRISALLLTAFISAFTIDLLTNVDNDGAWVMFIFRMIFLFVNVGMGLDYADGYYRDVDLHNLKSRLRIANEFNVWQEKRKQKEKVD